MILKILLKNSCPDSILMAKTAPHAGPQGDKRRGCSSVVERDLAKVDVESSNLFTRSIFLEGLEGIPGLCYLQLSPIV